MEQKRQYPNNIDAERALLNSILVDPDAAIDILDNFNEDDFYVESHQVIFKVMKELDRQNVSVDFVTLVDALENKDLMKKVGGLTYIDELTKEVPSTANYRNYIDILERDSICRKLIKAGDKIKTNALSSDDADLSLAQAEELIYNISEKKDRSVLKQAAPVAEEVLKKINLAISDKDSAKGMSSGFENLDKILNGLHDTDLMLVAARPAYGKTSFSMNIAANIVRDQPEKVVAVFSLEMAAEQLVQRMLATISEVSMKKMQRGDLGVEDLKKVYQASKIVGNSKLYIDDCSLTNPGQILSKCRRLVKKEGSIDLLVIDYLQLMVGSGGNESRQELVSEFSRRMKIIAKEINVPVILISQLSRAVERRDDKMPQLSDLRESGSIEQDADIVMLLHKPESENGDENLRQLIIAKHRNGETGSVFFKWRGECLSFQPCNDPSINISKSETGTSLNSGKASNYIENKPNNSGYENKFENYNDVPPPPPPIAPPPTSSGAFIPNSTVDIYADNPPPELEQNNNEKSEKIEDNDGDLPF